MKAEIVRQIDNLGRVVVPPEIRNALGWTEHSKISINMEENRLILELFQGQCFLCGSEENLQAVHGKFICKQCVDGLK